MLEWNLTQLATPTSTADLALAFGLSTGAAGDERTNGGTGSAGALASEANEAVLLARIHERELLLRWRHTIGRANGVQVSTAWQDGWTCAGCGRELRMPQEDTFLSLDGELCRGYAVGDGVELFAMSSEGRCGWC